MIHIVKNKKGFAVANIAKSGELLKISETLSSKAKCWKNIRAEMRDCYSFGTLGIVSVQDDTIKIPVIFYVNIGGPNSKTALKPFPIYQPGKNKK